MLYAKIKIPKNRNAMKKTMKFFQIFLSLAVYFGICGY